MKPDDTAVIVAGDRDTTGDSSEYHCEGCGKPVFVSISTWRDMTVAKANFQRAHVLCGRCALKAIQKQGKRLREVRVSADGATRIFKRKD